MVAFIKELSVKKKNWLDEGSFNEGVAIAQAVPGATALQVATYVGLKLRGIIGGIITLSAFALPAFILMLFLSWFYKAHSNLPQVAQVFKGLRIAIVAIVAKAFLDFFLPISKKPKEVAIAFLSFLLFYLGINPFLIIFICFSLSLFLFKIQERPESNFVKINWYKIFALIIFPFCFLGILHFFLPAYFELSAVMMKIDSFAFGGGYASLPLMLHEVVYKLKWMTEPIFMDGIALGQVTPGPIVITATFVGFYHFGLIGAIISTFSIFTPSFVIIASATELQEKIRNSTWFLRAKKGLIASFSGLLFYAELKFLTGVGWTPVSATLALVILVALLKRVNLLWVVAFTAALSLLIHF